MGYVKLAIILVLTSLLSVNSTPSFGEDEIEVVVSQGTSSQLSTDGIGQLIYDIENISISENGVYSIMIGSNVSNVKLDPPNNWQARLADIVLDPGSGWVAEARGSDAVLFNGLSGDWLGYAYGYLYWTHDGFVNGPDPIQVNEIISSFAITNELVPEVVPYVLTNFQISIGPDTPYTPTGSGLVRIACQGNCEDDTDTDGTDLALFSADYAAGVTEADLNDDQEVDQKDLRLIASNFGRCDCP